MTTDVFTSEQRRILTQIRAAISHLQAGKLTEIFENKMKVQDHLTTFTQTLPKGIIEKANTTAALYDLVDDKHAFFQPGNEIATANPEATPEEQLIFIIATMAALWVKYAGTTVYNLEIIKLELAALLDYIKAQGI
jgi:hypothetical protein